MFKLTLLSSLLCSQQILASGDEFGLKGVEITDVYLPEVCEDHATEGDWVNIHTKVSVLDSPDKELIGKILTDTRKVHRRVGTDQLLSIGEDDTPLNELNHKVIVGMCVGAKRAYSLTQARISEIVGATEDQRNAGIPDASVVEFEVELNKIHEGEPDGLKIFDFIDSNADQMVSLPEIMRYYDRIFHHYIPELEDEEERKKHQQQWIEHYVQFDADQNGLIDWSEWPGEEEHKGPEPTLERFFDEIDRNNDGKFSKADLKLWFAETRDITVPVGLFEEDDKDNDGFVTWAEFAVIQEEPKMEHPLEHSSL